MATRKQALSLRLATAADVEPLHRLFKVVLEELYLREGILESHGDVLASELASKSKALEDSLNGGPYPFYVAERDSEIVGTMALTCPNALILEVVPEAVTAFEISSVLVLPEHQGTGVASAMMQEIQNVLVEKGEAHVYLDCGYTQSQPFWIKQLGEPTWLLENHWGEGIHHMIWRLDPLKALIPVRRLLPANTVAGHLIKKYRKALWAPFKRAVDTYDMVPAGSKVAVAISGGKDSLLMAKLFQQLQRERHRDFELVFLAMDPGYDRENRQQLEANLAQLDIPTTIVDSDVFEASLKLSGKTPCYMCARMRRGVLYKAAAALGCDTLALGHHYDDVVETILMNVLCAGQFKTMLPKHASEKHAAMTLIRPLYFIREADIIRFSHFIGLEPMACGCSVTKQKGDSRRKEIKTLIKTLGQTFENVEHSIFSASKQVHLKYILGVVGTSEGDLGDDEDSDF